MHDANDTLITLTPRSAACRIALARLTTSPALRCRAASSAEGWAGENATEDCRIVINAASGAMPTMPSGAPGGRPPTNGWAPVGSSGPAAGASSGGGGGGGGAVTVTVAGLGGSEVGAGLAGTAGGGGGAPAPAGLGAGRAAG